MGHGKETPRQKMIGMMYLVLTALLALNVSAEVLNAFILIDKSMGQTGENFQKKNDEIYKSFESAMADPGMQAKAAPWKPKADKVKKLTTALINKMDELKIKLVKTADGEQSTYEGTNPDVIQAKDDNNVPSQIMVLEKQGEELKTVIESYKKEIQGLVDDPDKYSALVASINSTLNTDPIKGQDGQKKGWVEANFHHMPLAGVTTMISKIQTDVRNAESDILSHLWARIEGDTYKFNKIEAIVKSKSNFVLKGQPYEAEVFIAASDSTVTPKILIGGRALPVKEGKGIYRGGTNSVGTFPFGGVIELENPKTGETQKFPFKSEYQVGEPGVVISPTKMNVFYIGVKNPVDISVSGIPSDKVSATISSGLLRKVSGDQYVVQVKKAGKTYINVSAQTDAGSKSFGKKEFRVKRVPDPVAMVGDKKGGIVKKNALIAYGGVKAVMEGFDFALKYRVTGFVVSATTPDGYTVEERASSGRFTSKQIALIKRLSSGRKVYIENIKATGPDKRTLGNLVFKLQ